MIAGTDLSYTQIALIVVLLILWSSVTVIVPFVGALIFVIAMGLGISMWNRDHR